MEGSRLARLVYLFVFLPLPNRVFKAFFHTCSQKDVSFPRSEGPIREIVSSFPYPVKVQYMYFDKGELLHLDFYETPDML